MWILNGVTVCFGYTHFNSQIKLYCFSHAYKSKCAFSFFSKDVFWIVFWKVSSTKNFLFTLGVEEEHTVRCYKQEKKQTNMFVSVSSISVRNKRTKLWLYSILIVVMKCCTTYTYFQYAYKYILKDLMHLLWYLHTLQKR